MKKSIIIPVYNEEGNIGNLINKILSNIEPTDELIIVNDGSTDGTRKEIQNSRCLTINFNKNEGKGSAMKAGLEIATGEVIIFMGGDGQDDPNEIINLLTGIASGYDYVIGSRFIEFDNKKRFSSKAVMPINLFGNKALTSLINLLFGQNITDSQSEFKCFKSNKLQELDIESNGYEIETELLIKSFRKGFKIKEVPVHRYERKYGKSNLFDVPFGRFLFGLKVLKTILKGYFLWK